MATCKIKKGDMVKDIAGGSKGQTGRVVEVIRKKNRVLVEGVNMISKHEKPSMRNQDGGITHREAPIDISNVMYLHGGKPTRIGFKLQENGKKVRYAKSTGEVID